MTDRIDQFIEKLKWPAAAIAVILLLPSGFAFVNLVLAGATAPLAMFAFLFGAITYLVLWWNYFLPKRMTVAQTLEHEITHGIFAVLTGHRVTSLEAKSDDEGGMIHYRGGRGNWLITISPYFFPTFCLILIVPFALTHPPVTTIGNVLMGAAFALHLTSTFRETHLHQTDLRKVGIEFACAFLPTANILSTGLVLAFAHGDCNGMRLFLFDVFMRLRMLMILT